MKIVVTGMAGFIGSHLAEKLAKIGHTVVGIDNVNNYYNVLLKNQNLKILENLGVKNYKLDLAKDDLSEPLKDAEAIYHLAAQPGISADTSFEEYLTNNIIATRNLLDQAKNLKSLKVFVNTGTSSIYGLNANFPETKAPEPASYYGVTKLAAEQLVLSEYRENKFPACSLRLFSVYGERERPEKLYPRVFRSVYTDYKFPLYEGSENHVRSYTYISDIVDGFVAVLENIDKCLGEIINVGIDTTITTKEALEVVEKVTQNKIKYEIKPRRAGDQYSTTAVIDKARKLLNYEPKVKPEEGFAKVNTWFKEVILPLIDKGEI